MEFIFDSIKAVLLSLFFLIIVFIPLEKLFPSKKNQPVFRPAFWVDLCFLLGQYLLWNGLVLWVLDYSNSWLMTLVPATILSGIQAQPLWLQAVEVVLLSDFLIYWGHRLQHHHDFLWRFHKVHHTARHLDWLAAHREHPLDTIYTVGLINLPALVLGFPLEIIAGWIAFRGIWAIYIHSNTSINIGFLKYIFGSPEMHHWHHDIERDRGNYANLSPVMDIIFGTHYSQKKPPEQFGIREPFPENYTGQLLAPMVPESWQKKINRKKNQAKI